MYLSPTLHSDKLEDVVEQFLKKLEDTHPELKLEINKNRPALVERLTEVLKSHKNGNFDKRNLADPEFLKELTVTLVTAVSIHSMGLNPATDPLKKIQELLKSKGIDLTDPKLNPLSPSFDPAALKKELEKKLTPEDALVITNQMIKLNTRIVNDLEKSGLVQPKPTPDGKRPNIEEVMTKNLDPYAGLLGVMNHNVTGTFAVVVQCVVGNGLGFPDQNPYPGLAPIDRQNDPNDSATFGGDYQGINASTIGNFLTFTGDSFVNQFKDELKTSGLAMDRAPTPTPN